MEKMELVKKYVEELISAPINLVGYRDFNEAFHYLYMDSVLAVKPEDLGNNFLDVGTGGGVPGVFLLIEFGIHGFLIDSVCKKIDYVKNLCERLGLSNVELMCVRAEELKDKGMFRERFDSAVSRAVSRIATVLELTAPYVKVGGKVLLYKGPGYNEELGQAVNAMKELGVKLAEIRKYSILGKDRFLVIFEKMSPTPEKYPRKVGIPEKRPIR
ncbi:MAG: 16S rRNA (guanine(527)-N(7))-methyltransferase RsmG [Fervidobacterium pennivorans]|uniref:Ribosomal RNA small subunit methyltransferase G n=1 Tax=Fervidobacterium pennivorans TaxID=93466 RepID=A0A7C4VWD4_FERPE|nr:16S rRNA (guanine(527)-N(7))-methyltransferase RsmG [Fervidobacterium sp.]NPU89624.1 16S rRNA (guanine(527)-N(7))-methyltransferase RsmG [Fervidobacterium sp.]